jgi:hypothetical protein
MPQVRLARGAQGARRAHDLSGAAKRAGSGITIRDRGLEVLHRDGGISDDHTGCAARCSSINWLTRSGASSAAKWLTPGSTSNL